MSSLCPEISFNDYGIDGLPWASVDTFLSNTRRQVMPPNSCVCLCFCRCILWAYTSGKIVRGSGSVQCTQLIAII